MFIKRIRNYDLLCQECGSHIYLSADEYREYCKETEDYGNTILCTEKDENGKKYEIYYVNFDCPVCGHYIPVTVSNSDLDADRYGFCYSKKAVTPNYGEIKEMSMSDYLANVFFKEQEELEVDESL